jgi:hypothetical protein
MSGGFPGIVVKQQPKKKQPKTFSPLLIKPVKDIISKDTPPKPLDAEIEL